MKNYRKMCVLSLMIVTAFALCAGEYGFSGEIKAKSKTKTKLITMYKGEMRKISIKKKSKIKITGKKVISVSKKGKIKALKVGKCKITVKKGKKTWKYNVVVNKKPVIKVTPTPTPTATPVPTLKPEIHGIGLDPFEILQKEITTETKYLTYKLNFPKEALTFYVKIGDKCFEQTYKAETQGEGEYNFYMDFSSYEPGTEIEVGIRPYSDRIEDQLCIWNTRVEFLSKEFVLNKLFEAEQLSFVVDQEEITTETTVISGTLSNNEHIDAVIEIFADGYVIASEKIKAGEKTFSIPVDFSKCDADDMVSIIYGCPNDVCIYEADDYIIHYDVNSCSQKFVIRRK